MKYTEQDLKDEYEQAVKRKGKLYAEGYVEGLKDAQNQALTIPVVVGQSEQLVCNCQGCGKEKIIEYCEKCYAENLTDLAN